MEIIDCRKNYSNMIIDIILFRLEIRDKFGFIAQFCKKMEFYKFVVFHYHKKKKIQILSSVLIEKMIDFVTKTINKRLSTGQPVPISKNLTSIIPRYSINIPINFNSI